MNTRRNFGGIAAVLVLLLIIAGIALSAPSLLLKQTLVAAEAPKAPPVAPPVPPDVPHPAPPADPAAATNVSELITGDMVTQTFTLAAGWNAIYLEVDPVNTSPLVNEGTAEQPRWVHEKSVMQAVFGGLEQAGALDSVWTYNQPVSNKDYIIDPGEGLWDDPGWLRYIPESATGPDGQSGGFLTNLHSLHANTGYLVKLNTGTSGTVTVTGKPVPGHHRWQPGAYNLSGFPIAPNTAPTVGAFILGSPAPITEVRQLTSDGKWTAAMSSASTLSPGTAYLVRYAADAATPDYTAPLDLAAEDGGGLPSEGLNIQAGIYGNNVALMVKNRSAANAEVTLSLPEGLASKVALHYAQGQTNLDLRSAPVTVNLGPAPGDTSAARLQFLVPADLQPNAGQAILAITCSSLGTRWLVPLAASPATRAGLWVGDVVINDVSQARVGGSDERMMAIPMAAMNSSGVKGAADLAEVGGTTVKITLTLDLPAATRPAILPPEVQAPYVQGRVYVDADQNGKADRTEAGVEGVTVSFGGGATATTAADGSYRLHLVGSDSPPIVYSITPPDPPGYTRDFTIQIPNPVADGNPVTAANARPESVTIDSLGAITATSQMYLNQTLAPPHTLPMWDENGKRVEPPLNFGYVRADQAGIYAGPCTAPRERLYPPAGQPAWTVVNGKLVAEVSSSLAGLIGAGSSNNISVIRDGAVIACGDIIAGAPTAFTDGRGSLAKFRILLRVSSARTVALLPYYVMGPDQRISAVNFLSLQEPITITGPFGQSGTGLVFDLGLPGNDPLNPFKHKYNPDHDNLNQKFNPIQDSILYESYDVERLITLVLRDLPSGGSAETAASLDWGGAVWGGDYRETLDGLHKNTITVRGTFTIRKVLSLDQLRKQDYDK